MAALVDIGKSVPRNPQRPTVSHNGSQSTFTEIYSMAWLLKLMRSLVPGTVVVLGMVFGSSHAAGCSWLLEIQFSDGSKGCLTDYPISNAVPRGYNQTLKALLGRNVSSTVGNRYAVATSPVSNNCPMVVGYATPLGTTSEDSSKAGAVTSCNQSLDSLTSKKSDSCRCSTIIVSGTALLNRSDFELHAGLGNSSIAIGPSSAPETSKASTASTPTKTGTINSANVSRDEVDELRAQLKALRDQTEAGGKKTVPTAIATPTENAILVTRPNSIRISAQALVIGNSAYTAFGKLPNPRNDARAIAAKLRSFGIDVDLVLDADRGALVNSLNQYQSKAVGKDVNILYYAGHGVQVNGINYLVPTDMRADGVTAGYIKLNGVSLNDALDYLPAKTKLVFLDACRDNPASRSLVASRSAGAVGLAPVNTATGTLIAYATKEGATADDGNGANSPYTTALLENLDAQLDISIVLRKVRQRVMALTSGRQEPWEYGSLMGDQLILSTMAK